MTFSECEFDKDCPVAMLCYKNVSWAIEATGISSHGVCLCNSWYGWCFDENGDCFKFSTTTYVLIIILSLQIGIAWGLGCFGWAKLIQLGSTFGKKIRNNPTAITLASSTLGLNLLVAWQTLNLITTVSPKQNDHYITKDENAEKVGTLSLPLRPIVFFTLMLMTVAVAKVSEMWFNVLHQYGGKIPLMKSPETYKRVVRIYLVLFGICVGIVAALGRWELASLIITPFIVLAGLTIFMGRRHMQKMLTNAIEQNVSSSSASSDSGASCGGRDEPQPAFLRSPSVLSFVSKAIPPVRREKKSLSEKAKRTLNAILKVSRRIFISITVSVVAGVIFFLLNVPFQDHRWRAHAKGFGSLSLVSLVNEVSSCAVLYTLSAVMLYSVRNAKKMLRRKTTTPTSQESSYETDGTKVINNSTVVTV